MSEKNDRQLRVSGSNVLPYLQYIANDFSPSAFVGEVTVAFRFSMTAVIMCNNSEVIFIASTGKSAVTLGMVAKTMQNLNHRCRWSGVFRCMPVMDGDAVTIGGGQLVFLIWHWLVARQPSDAGFRLVDPESLCFPVVPRREIGGNDDFFVFGQGRFLVSL